MYYPHRCLQRAIKELYNMSICQDEVKRTTGRKTLIALSELGVSMSVLKDKKGFKPILGFKSLTYAAQEQRFYVDIIITRKYE
jgi:hypothetical protein